MVDLDEVMDVRIDRLVRSQSLVAFERLGYAVTWLSNVGRPEMFTAFQRLGESFHVISWLRNVGGSRRITSHKICFYTESFNPSE